MLFGDLLANTGLAVANYVKGTGTPYFIPIIAADDLTQRARIPNVIRVAGYSASQTTRPLGRLGAEAGLQARRHHQPGLHLRPRAVRRLLPRRSPKAAARSSRSSGTRSTPPISAPIWASSPISSSTPCSRWRPARTRRGSSRPMRVSASRTSMPLLGAMNLTDQSVIRTLGDEALGIISPGHFAEGLGQSQGRGIRQAAPGEVRHDPVALWLLDVFGGDVGRQGVAEGWRQDRPGDPAQSGATPPNSTTPRSARPSSSMPTATRSTTSTSARWCATRQGKLWNVPIADYPGGLAVLAVRSRDLHEAAALLPQLPGHQEEPERCAGRLSLRDVSVRFGGLARSTASASRSRPESAGRSSVRTAPARPRCSTRSPAPFAPATARSSSTAAT